MNTNKQEKYDEITDFHKGFACVRQGDKWGYINEKGEEVIPFIYEDTTYFHKDYVAVKKDGKWGFIN